MSRTVSGKERDALHTVVAEAAAAVSGSSRRRTDAAVAAVAFFIMPINKKIICLFNNTAILTIFSDRSPSPLIWQFPNSLLEEESESETIGGEWEYKARACGKLMLLLIFCSCSRRKEQWKRQWSERRRRGHRTSGLEAA